MPIRCRQVNGNANGIGRLAAARAPLYAARNDLIPNSVKCNGYTLGRLNSQHREPYFDQSKCYKET